MDIQQDWNTYFEANFFDVRKHKPQKGQVMARYTAIAHLQDGQLKREPN